MNIQTGTIEITGVNPEILRRLDQRAKAAESTAEDYVRALIEQEYAQMEFTPAQTETLRQEVTNGGEQIQQGNYSRYNTVGEMMDGIEATFQERLARKQIGQTQ
jgi:predicted DNA-binding protein